MDFSIGKSDKSREYTYRVCPSGFPVDSASAFEVKAEVPAIDLEDECDVYALQVNYFDHETEYYNKVDGLRQRYVIEGSLDGRISQVSETVRLQ